MTLAELEALVMEQQATLEANAVASDNTFILGRAFTILTMVSDIKS